MTFFKTIFLFLPLFVVGITNNNPNIDENYLNKVYYYPPSTQADTDIEQRAGYNFIVQSISIVTDCINIPCSNTDLEIKDSTNSGNISKYYYSADPLLKSEIINKDPIKITGVLNIDNLSLDAGLYISVTGYYLNDKDNYFFDLSKQLLNSSVNDVISIIILYVIYIYIIYFFSSQGFKLGRDYFFKKRKNENS